MIKKVLSGVNFGSVLRVRRIGVLIILISLLSLRAQGQDNNHNQAWFDISGSIKLSDQLSLIPEVGFRTEPSIDLNQVYFRTYLNFRPHRAIKLSAWAAQFNSWRSDNQRATEVRTSQFVSVYWPRVAGFKFEYRLGLDQRIFFLPGYELRKYVHRSRIKIGLHTPVFSLLKSPKAFYGNGSFEVLRNMNQQEVIQWIDHDWISVTLGYRLSESLKIEANMLLINLLDPVTNDFEREITVYRLRFKGNFH